MDLKNAGNSQETKGADTLFGISLILISGFLLIRLFTVKIAERDYDHGSSFLLLFNLILIVLNLCLFNKKQPKLFKILMITGFVMSNFLLILLYPIPFKNEQRIVILFHININVGYISAYKYHLKKNKKTMEN